MPRLLTLLISIVVLTICIGLNVHRYPMVWNQMREAGPVISVSVSSKDTTSSPKDTVAEDAVVSHVITPSIDESDGAVAQYESVPTPSDVSSSSSSSGNAESGLVELRLPEQPMELPAESTMVPEPRRTTHPITLTAKTQPLSPQNTEDITAKRIMSASNEKIGENDGDAASDANAANEQSIVSTTAESASAESTEPKMESAEPKTDANEAGVVAETGEVSESISSDASGWESHHRPMTRQEIRSWLRQRN